jgi:hypothetical protein
MKLRWMTASLRLPPSLTMTRVARAAPARVLQADCQEALDLLAEGLAGYGAASATRMTQRRRPP